MKSKNDLHRSFAQPSEKKAWGLSGLHLKTHQTVELSANVSHRARHHHAPGLLPGRAGLGDSQDPQCFLGSWVVWGDPGRGRQDDGLTGGGVAQDEAWQALVGRTRQASFVHGFAQSAFDGLDLKCGEWPGLVQAQGAGLHPFALGLIIQWGCIVG